MYWTCSNNAKTNLKTQTWLIKFAHKKDIIYLTVHNSIKMLWKMTDYNRYQKAIHLFLTWSKYFKRIVSHIIEINFALTLAVRSLTLIKFELITDSSSIRAYHYYMPYLMMDALKPTRTWIDQYDWYDWYGLKGLWTFNDWIRDKKKSLNK